MKLSHLFALIILALVISACTTGKVNYKINDQGQIVVEKTAEGEVAIRGDAANASSEAAEFEKNMTIKVMYGKYLGLIEKGDFEGAKKLRIEIEVLRGKVASTPDTPVLTPSVVTPLPKNGKEDPYEDPQTKMKRVAKKKKK